MSITLSLIAVFIPLFLMGGYVGKLFQEFAVTVSVALLLSLIISLTLTPMMCARLLKHEPARSTDGSTGCSKAVSMACRQYERGLRIVLRHRFVTLMVMLCTIALTGYLYVVIPKGFFPQQDTGLIIGIAEAAQDISFPGDGRAPAGAGRRRAEGSGGRVGRLARSARAAATATLNQGRVFIVLKPQSERNASTGQVIDRLRPKLAKIQGITLYMQAAQDITIGAGCRRPSISTR